MQRKINTVCYHLCVESKHKANEQNQNRLTENKLVITSWKRESGRGKLGVGIKRHKLLGIKK